MCHRLSGSSTYGLKGLRKGDKHPAYAQHWVRHLYLYLLTYSLTHLLIIYVHRDMYDKDVFMQSMSINSLSSCDAIINNNIIIMYLITLHKSLEETNRGSYDTSVHIHRVPKK